MSGDQRLITNEQIKLRATFWNNLAVATVAGGIFLPFYNYFRDPNNFFSNLQTTDFVPGLFIALVSVILSALMKAYADRTLSKLS